MIGVDVDRDENESGTSPLTGRSGAQVRANTMRLKQK
jgi:hypothetical protein